MNDLDEAGIGEMGFTLPGESLVTGLVTGVTSVIGASKQADAAKQVAAQETNQIKYGGIVASNQSQWQYAQVTKLLETAGIVVLFIGAAMVAVNVLKAARK